MDAGDWIALVALLVAVAAAYFAWVSARAARRSAKEAATISHIEGDRRAEERERRHEELGPPSLGELPVEVEEGDGRGTLFGSITVPRAYRVQAQAWTGSSTTPIGLSLLLEANRPYRFQVEPWPPGQRTPRTREVRFRFWPPVEGDDTDHWGCPCDRPTGEDTNGPGHWERRVPVTYEHYDPLDSIF